MTTVSVTLVKPAFTATILSAPSFTVAVNDNIVNVSNTSTTVTVDSTINTTQIVTDGILSVMAPSTSTTVLYVADGVTSIYSLFDEVIAQAFVEVAVGGVLQEPNNSYTVFTTNTGTATATSYVSFVEIPPNGVDIQLTFYTVSVARDYWGPQGPQGEQGIQGDVGPKGDKGDKGDTGYTTWNYIGNRIGAYGPDAIAIGRLAGGYTDQGAVSVAIGSQAGEVTQQNYAIAIGRMAGNRVQGQDSIAIGHRAGTGTQATFAVAIGPYAGETNQSDFATAVGRYAGQVSQGTRTVALGSRAGEQNQGDYSVAVGGTAGQVNQHKNTIVLNAQGSESIGSISLNTDRENAFFVKPIRHPGSSIPSGFHPMYYNPTTGEIIVVY